jgi:hypothetical protein
MSRKGVRVSGWGRNRGVCAGDGLGTRGAGDLNGVRGGEVGVEGLGRGGEERGRFGRGRRK